MNHETNRLHEPEDIDKRIAEIESVLMTGHMKAAFPIQHRNMRWLITQLKACREESVSKLVEDAHNLAKEKGWWDKDLERTFGDFCALLHSEVSEAYEDFRNGRGLSEIYYEGEKPCGIPIEFADLMIRIADNAAAFGFDLEYAIKIKMAYNKKRTFRYGGKKT